MIFNITDNQISNDEINKTNFVLEKLFILLSARQYFKLSTLDDNLKFLSFIQMNHKLSLTEESLLINNDSVIWGLNFLNSNFTNITKELELKFNNCSQLIKDNGNKLLTNINNMNYLSNNNHYSIVERIYNKEHISLSTYSLLDQFLICRILLDKEKEDIDKAGFITFNERCHNHISPKYSEQTKFVGEYLEKSNIEKSILFFLLRKFIGLDFLLKYELDYIWCNLLEYPDKILNEIFIGISR